MNKSSKIPFILSIVSALLLFLLVARNPQGLYSDVAWQLKALQQYIAGESPSLNHVSMPRPDDLSQNTSNWISWWPPGTQLCIYPLLKNKIALGDAIRIVVIIFIIIGTLGWIKWFLFFQIPRWIIITFSIALPWVHYNSNALFLYNAEILVYGLAPWILLLIYSLRKEIINEKNKIELKDLSIIALIGFILGLVYFLKYSFIFISLGAICFFGLKLFSRRNPHKLKALANFLTLALFFITPIFILRVLNLKLGVGLDPATIGPGIMFRWQSLLYISGFPVLAMTDAFSLLNYILFHSPVGFLGRPLLLGFIGLPGSLLLFWLISRSRRFKDHEFLSLAVFLTSCAVLFVIWTITSTVSYEARHLTAASLTILPFIIQEACIVYKKKIHHRLKLILILAAIGYIFIPLFFGLVSVVAKVIRTPLNYRLGAEKIYNPLLADFDLSGVWSRLESLPDPNKDIWFIPDPVTALNISGRTIITHADFQEPQVLRQQQYSSLKPLKVFALLPRHFEANGKGLIIRNSFIQAVSWEKKEIAGCNYLLWITNLQLPQEKNAR